MVNTRQSKNAVRSQRSNVARWETLLGHVEAVSMGSAELDNKFTAVFPSALPKISQSIDAVTQLIGTELPGWWWTCGFCKSTNDASLYPPGSCKFAHASMGPDGRSGPAALRLIYDKERGKIFDHGFHRDRQGGTVPLSLLSAFLQAKIALAKANFSTDPKQIRREEHAAVRASKRGVEAARKLLARSRRAIQKMQSA